MKPLRCQCCGFTFSPVMRGTNRDQSKNLDYCKFCFKDGEFKDHQLTIQVMERKLLDMAKRNDDLCIEEAYAIIQILPDLKRWKMTHVL